MNRNVLFRYPKIKTFWGREQSPFPYPSPVEVNPVTTLYPPRRLCLKISGAATDYFKHTVPYIHRVRIKKPQ